jgi:dTDP-4-amino-4,6-dideoxygalactose transaminase
MTRFGPRILLIGGTYRALCALERLLERGYRVAAFIGVEGGGERDFCPEILEICDRNSIPARSGHKLGEEIVRWLEDRIRPELSIAIGVRAEVPVAVGGNCRLGLIEATDLLMNGDCPGVTLRQRGKPVCSIELPGLRDELEASDAYMRVVDTLVDALDDCLAQLVPVQAAAQPGIRFFADAPEADLDWLDREPVPGRSTDALERALGAYVGAERVLALRSIQGAFALLASALGLRDGAEVICAGIGSPQAALGLASAGARLGFADVHPDRLTVNPERVSEAISPATRALLISHVLGQPAELDLLYGIAESRRLEILEDGGASLGARFGDSRLGRSPCTAVFRLPLGPESANREAALVTLPPALAARVEPLAKDLRLGERSAALALRELDGLEARISARRERARTYSAEFSRYDAFRIPATPRDALSTHAGYLLRLTRFARTTADDLHKLLAECSIETRRLELPLRDRDLAGLPSAEGARASGLLLPVEAHLTPDDQERVLDAIFGYAIG